MILNLGRGFEHYHGWSGFGCMTGEEPGRRLGFRVRVKGFFGLCAIKKPGRFGLQSGYLNALFLEFRVAQVQ